MHVICVGQPPPISSPPSPALHQLPPFHSQLHVFSGPPRKQMRLSAWQDEKSTKGWVSSTASGSERVTLLGKQPAGPLPSPPQSVFSAVCKGCPPQTEAWVLLGTKGKRTSVPKGPQGSCLCECLSLVQQQEISCIPGPADNTPSFSELSQTLQ